MAVIAAGISPNPTLAEVALALRVNGGLFERMTRADALAAARERGVPLQDGRVLKGHIGVVEIAFGHRQRMQEPRVEVGQVWASNDSRDRATDNRQRREVTSVVFHPDTRARNAPYGRAYLKTLDNLRAGSFGVKLTRNGMIDRHRLVHP